MGKGERSESPRGIRMKGMRMREERMRRNEEKKGKKLKTYSFLKKKRKSPQRVL